jgi:hypothetical protein
MEELFDPSNFVWIIPMCAFGVFIICATCFVLRKEIKGMIDKLLFPYKNRYSMPAGIITKGSIPKEGEQTSYTVMKESSGLAEIPLLLTPLNPHDLPAAQQAEQTTAAQEQQAAQPSAVQKQEAAKPQEEVKEAPAQTQEKAQEQKPSSVSKLREFIKDFNAILFPQAQSCFSPKQDAAQNNVIDPNLTLPPVPPTPAAVKEEQAKAKEAVQETPTPKLDILEVPAQQSSHKAEDKAKSPYFIKDRYIIILSLLILSGFVIFLSARVRLLSAIQQRQYIEIKQLKEQLADAKGGNAGKKVIIYVPIGSNRIQK